MENKPYYKRYFLVQLIQKLPGKPKAIYRRPITNIC